MSYEAELQRTLEYAGRETDKLRDRIAQLERDLADTRERSAEWAKSFAQKCVEAVALETENSRLQSEYASLLETVTRKVNEKIEAERDRLAAELRNDQAELKRLMQAVPGAHFCQDWDGLLVWPGTPEADACTCALPSGEPQ